MRTVQKIKRWLFDNFTLVTVIICLIMTITSCIVLGLKRATLWQDALDKLVTTLISFLGFSVTGYIFLNNMLQARKTRNSIETEVIVEFQNQKKEKLIKHIVLITGCVLVRFCLKYSSVSRAMINSGISDVIKYVVFAVCTFISVYSIILLGIFLYEMINYEQGLKNLAQQKRKEHMETKEQEPVSKGTFLNLVNNMDIVANRLIQNHTYAQTAYMFESALKTALCDGITDQGKIHGRCEFANNYQELIDYRNLLIQDKTIQDGENVSYGATAQKLINELFKEYLQNEILTNVSLSNIVLQNADLSYASFAGSALYNIEFKEKSVLQKTDFRDSTLNTIVFHDADCANANFTNSKLINIRFNNATNLQRTIFDDADLTGMGKFGTPDKLDDALVMFYAKFRNALLSNLDIYNINFTYAEFDNAQFVDCKVGDSTTKELNVIFEYSSLKDTNFLRALITRTSFKKAKLNRVNMTYAKINETAFDEANLEGAGFIETKINRTSFYKCYAAGISFKGSNIECANFTYATMTNADLSGARVKEVRFNDCICRNVLAVGVRVSYSSFTGVVFQNSRIVGEDKQTVEFYQCDFSNADFSDTAISNIVFKECMFEAADFTSARLINVDFEECIGLNTAVTNGAWIHGGNAGTVLKKQDSWRYCQ